MGTSSCEPTAASDVSSIRQVLIAACHVQAIDVLCSKLPTPNLASSSEQGIAVGTWKGAMAPMAGQGEQQGRLSVTHAQEILGSMQSMLALKEAGNR